MLTPKQNKKSSQKISGQINSLRLSFAKAIIVLAEHENTLRTEGKSDEADKIWEEQKEMHQAALKMEKANADYIASTSIQPIINDLIKVTIDAKAALKKLKNIKESLNTITELIKLFQSAAKFIKGIL